MNNLILDSDTDDNSAIGDVTINLNRRKILVLIAFFPLLNLIVLGYTYYLYLDGCYSVKILIVYPPLLILLIIKSIKYFSVLNLWRKNKSVLVIHKNGIQDNIALRQFIPWNRVLGASIISEQTKTYLSIDVKNIEEFTEKLNFFQRFWLSVEELNGDNSYYKINAMFFDYHVDDIVEIINLKIKEKHQSSL